MIGVKAWLLKRWFLIALAGVLAVGFSGAGIFAPLADAPLLRRGIVSVVLFVMALPLGLSAVWRAIRYPAPALLAAGINFGVLPLVAWGLYLAVMVPLGLNHQLAVGILIAAATPSTLASAAVWTRRAGGNDTVPVLVTLITNLSCFVVTPLWLVTMTGEQVGAVELGPMVVKLLCLIVLPMSAAQLCRLRAPVRDWAAAHKGTLGVVAQCGVLAMILVGSVRAGLSIRQAEASALAVDRSSDVTANGYTGSANPGHSLVGGKVAVGDTGAISDEEVDSAASAGLGDYGLMIALVLTIHLSMLALGHLVGVWLGNLDGSPMRELSGATGPAQIMRSVFAFLNRDLNARPLYLSPKLEQMRACMRVEVLGGCAHYRDEWFVPGTHADEPPAVDAVPSPRIRRPTPGLHLALDPRIPAHLQKFRLALERDTSILNVEWYVDGKLVTGDTLEHHDRHWTLTRGTHVVTAKVWQAHSSETFDTRAVKFEVR